MLSYRGRLRFVIAKETAEQAEARASHEAAALAREEAALDRQREMVAATALQAWARGVESRRAVSAVLEARGLPPLAAEQRRRVRKSESIESHVFGIWRCYRERSK